MKCLRLAVPVLLLVAVAGCVDTPKAKVKGRVTLDGVPLQDGGIRFIPSDGKAPTAGATIEDGEYAVESIAVTNMRVEITAPKVVGKRKAYDTPDSPMIDNKKELLPARYNVKTELTRDIQKGDNVFDFQLTSK
jgi:hypothetical protein